MGAKNWWVDGVPKSPKESFWVSLEGNCRRFTNPRTKKFPVFRNTTVPLRDSALPHCISPAPYFSSPRSPLNNLREEKSSFEIAPFWLFIMISKYKTIQSTCATPPFSNPMWPVYDHKNFKLFHGLIKIRNASKAQTEYTGHHRNDWIRMSSRYRGN